MDLSTAIEALEAFNETHEYDNREELTEALKIAIHLLRSI